MNFLKKRECIVIFFFSIFRARRTAEAERDDLQEEINSSAGKGSLHSDEKRRKAIIIAPFYDFFPLLNDF